MEFQDRILRCVDCGAEFIWTAGEQQFFADKNFKNEPKRCKACKAKRASRPAGGGDGPRTGGNGRPSARPAARKRRCRSGRRRGARCSARNASSPGSSPGPAASERPPVSLRSDHVDAARGRAARHGAAMRRARERCVKLTARIHLERFHADRGTDRRRRGGARPEGQDHPGRRRRAAQGQGQQPRQPGSQEDRPEPGRRAVHRQRRASAKSSAPTPPSAGRAAASSCST